MTLQNKILLIIGGTSGFGYCVANLAFEKGAKLILTGRDPAKLDRVVENMKSRGADVTGYPFNAANREELGPLFKNIGTFDHLVSMAGGAMGGGFLDTSEETIRTAIEEKFFANMMIARAAAPFVHEGGSMVFTAGSGGRPHNASGAIIGNEAISTMVQGLAVELAPKVRVNAVAPTWTETPLWREMPGDKMEQTRSYFASAIPLRRTAKIEEVASAYIFLMENTFITGQTIQVDGGVTLVS